MSTFAWPFRCRRWRHHPRVRDEVLLWFWKTLVGLVGVTLVCCTSSMRLFLPSGPDSGWTWRDRTGWRSFLERPLRRIPPPSSGPSETPVDDRWVENLGPFYIVKETRTRAKICTVPLVLEMERSTDPPNLLYHMTWGGYDDSGYAQSGEGWDGEFNVWFQPECGWRLVFPFYLLLRGVDIGFFWVSYFYFRGPLLFSCVPFCLHSSIPDQKKFVEKYPCPLILPFSYGPGDCFRQRRVRSRLSPEYKSSSDTHLVLLAYA